MQRLQVGNHLLHVGFVKGQRSSHIVEDANVIHNQAIILAGVGTIYAADTLQQVMLLHRFVQIHHLQNRGIKPGQKA